MTYPSSDVSTTDMDAGTDVPATARSSILDLAQKFNLLRNFITTIGQAIISAGNAGAARTAIGAAASGPLAASGITGAAASGNNADITSWSGGQLAGLRNAILNGNFGINQRAVSGTVVLTAGQYGHDRFKAGASGCTYTFSTTANVTTLTISAGSLQQVIEGANLQSGTYALSWSGTAQGKIGAGSYGASGITGAITGGTNTTIEFGPGTVSKVQLEFGSTPTVFEQRPYGLELALCQRYYYKSYNMSAAPGSASNPGVLYTVSGSGSGFYCYTSFPVSMRTTPTITTYNPSTGTSGQWNSSGGSIAASASIPGETGAAINGSTVSAGQFAWGHIVASAEL